MWMRHLRMLPILLGVVAFALTPSDAAAQRARSLPYHMLLTGGASGPATDSSLATALKRAEKRAESRAEEKS